ncbi:hypothetical protein [Pararhodobacter sp. CCB-MM2]|uniref:hypothetical protein n=1 Tax=Pararhodobacter sp. CCB-MM2 TaxID=1786003 RepID=UPI001314A1C3|nr:hypothetical protein [Pararhodobacter sp. CCB-MM2]
MTRPDFTAHPYLGIIAAHVLEDFRFAMAKPVTLAPANTDDSTPPTPAAPAMPAPGAAA